jgi:paraquat-inducible protein A
MTRVGALLTWLRALELPALIALASVCLYFGIRTPLITVEKAFFLENDYSIWSGIVGLWKDGEWFLAALVFFFSFVFPILKLALLAWITFGRLGAPLRTRALHMLEELGRWSMLDVFAVAILIVATKLGPLAQVDPQPGVYWFAAAVLGSMVATRRVRQRAFRPT